MPHPALILGHPPVRLHSSNSAAPRDSPFSECLSWEWHPVSTHTGQETGLPHRQASSCRMKSRILTNLTKKPIYTPVQIPHRIGGLKPTELNPMPCHNLKAGFILPCKADSVSLLLELDLSPIFPTQCYQKASLSSLTIPSLSCTTSNWSARPVEASFLIAFESPLHQPLNQSSVLCFPPSCSINPPRYFLSF